MVGKCVSISIMFFAVVSLFLSLLSAVGVETAERMPRKIGMYCMLLLHSHGPAQLL